MIVEHATVVAWRQGEHWHRMRFEQADDGTMMRREYTRGSPDDAWRPVGSAIVEDVTIEEVVNRSSWKYFGSSPTRSTGVTHYPRG